MSELFDVIHLRDYVIISTELRFMYMYIGKNLMTINRGKGEWLCVVLHMNRSTCIYVCVLFLM